MCSDKNEMELIDDLYQLVKNTKTAGLELTPNDIYKVGFIIATLESITSRNGLQR